MTLVSQQGFSCHNGQCKLPGTFDSLTLLAGSQHVTQADILARTTEKNPGRELKAAGI